MDGNLTPHDVDTLLRELARRLQQSEATAGIRIVGGAALALMNDQRRTTRDIDAALHPADVIKAVAADIAQAHGLPPNWLNDAALAYIPPVGPEDWIDVVREGSVTIAIGSPQMLLAMKLYANRGRRDADDIDYLLGVCGVTTVQEAQEIYERYHAQDVLTDQAVARIEHWLGSGSGRPGT
jgi:hypothetical protein